jgi:hypothetical protein
MPMRRAFNLLHVPELLPSSLARASEVLEQGVPCGRPEIDLKVHRAAFILAMPANQYLKG